MFKFVIELRNILLCDIINVTVTGSPSVRLRSNCTNQIGKLLIRAGEFI